MASVRAADCGSTAFFRLAGAFRLRSQGSIRPFSYRSLTQERERGLFCRSVATFRNRPGHFPAPTGLPAPLRPDFFRRNGLPIRPGSAMQTAARARPLVARAPHVQALRPQSSFSHPLSPTPKSSPRLPHFRPSLRRPPGLPTRLFLRPALPARRFHRPQTVFFQKQRPGRSCGTFRAERAGPCRPEGVPERTPPSCGRRARLFSYLW